MVALISVYSLYHRRKMTAISCDTAHRVSRTPDPLGKSDQYIQERCESDHLSKRRRADGTWNSELTEDERRVGTENTGGVQVGCIGLDPLSTKYSVGIYCMVTYSGMRSCLVALTVGM
jgi:hypothetical protein